MSTNRNKKAALIGTAVAVGVFAAHQVYTYIDDRNTESQPYRLIRDDDGFQIRFYPPVAMASVNAATKSFDKLSRQNFGKVADYIFGGNERHEEIAMTKPVHMAEDWRGSKMSFVMPGSYAEENLPEPNDTGVNLETSDAEYVAAITFGGFASDDKIATKTKELRQLIEAKGLNHRGPFRFLGYNAPWQLIGRKNEIIVRIDWHE